jgi:predicted flavoprotein YhiN
MSRTLEFAGPPHDVVIIGAGAAGLAAGIFAARLAPHLRILVVDGARKIGAKILVSGGSRCNVTNRVVRESDFWGGPSRVVKRVLRAFPADRAAAFFHELGVALHEEEGGKLFPASQRSRTVLAALLEELRRRGVPLDVGVRVSDVRPLTGGFVIATASGTDLVARRVVLATGGLSLPKTGSDGHGYVIAQRLGHGRVPTTPALAPLLLGLEPRRREATKEEPRRREDRKEEPRRREDTTETSGKLASSEPQPEAGHDDARDPERCWHRALTGVAHPAALTLHAAGLDRPLTLTGPILWTHFGASGPVALNMSRHWHRAEIEGRSPRLSIALCPEESFASLDAWLLDRATARPRAAVHTVLAERVPGAVADVWASLCGIERDTTMAHMEREARRRLVHALLAAPLKVAGSRGYGYAEVTAGGVPLDEIDPATMESRLCPGLHFAGEILDVDGRLGGFNFQWAWSSAFVAAQGVVRGLARGQALGAGSDGDD